MLSLCPAPPAPARHPSFTLTRHARRHPPNTKHQRVVVVHPARDESTSTPDEQDPNVDILTKLLAVVIHSTFAHLGVFCCLVSSGEWSGGEAGGGRHHLNLPSLPFFAPPPPPLSHSRDAPPAPPTSTLTPPPRQTTPPPTLLPPAPLRSCRLLPTASCLLPPAPCPLPPPKSPHSHAPPHTPPRLPGRGK